MGEPRPLVELRPVVAADIGVFFEHQADAGAAQMVGFASRPRPEHDVHWARVLADRTGLARTIVAAGQVVGNIVSWTDGEQRLVGYWIGREHWGRGYATAALQAFLGILTERPLVALVAQSNRGSIRVLEKCGFLAVGTEQHEGDPVVEVRMVLGGPGPVVS